MWWNRRCIGRGLFPVYVTPLPPLSALRNILHIPHPMKRRSPTQWKWRTVRKPPKINIFPMPMPKVQELQNHTTHVSHVGQSGVPVQLSSYLLDLPTKGSFVLRRVGQVATLVAETEGWLRLDSVAAGHVAKLVYERRSCILCWQHRLANFHPLTLHLAKMDSKRENWMEHNFI